jgi:hypothetical protein
LSPPAPSPPSTEGPAAAAVLNGLAEANAEKALEPEKADEEVLVLGPDMVKGEAEEEGKEEVWCEGMLGLEVEEEAELVGRAGLEEEEVDANGEDEEAGVVDVTKGEEDDAKERKPPEDLGLEVVGRAEDEEEEAEAEAAVVGWREGNGMDVSLDARH